MRLTLDDLDRKLLTLLQANARAPVTTLARKLGVARTTVVARIARLEKNGVIGGYGVRLGKQDDRGLQSFCALRVEPKAGPAVVRRLSKIAEIQQLCAVSGVWDYMALLHTESAARLDEILDEIGGIDGVKQTTSAIVLASKIDRR